MVSRIILGRSSINSSSDGVEGNNKPGQEIKCNNTTSRTRLLSDVIENTEDLETGLNHSQSKATHGIEMTDFSSKTQNTRELGALDSNSVLESPLSEESKSYDVSYPMQTSDLPKYEKRSNFKERMSSIGNGIKSYTRGWRSTKDMLELDSEISEDTKNKETEFKISNLVADKSADANSDSQYETGQSRYTSDEMEKRSNVRKKRKYKKDKKDKNRGPSEILAADLAKRIDPNLIFPVIR